ncbi:MAG: AraC family transcriptional regulator [Pseudomonadota bacterium]
MATADVFLRGGASALLLLCACVFWSFGGLDRKRVSVMVLCGALVPYLLLSSPTLAPDGALESVLRAVAALIPVVLYWATLELFVDEPEVRGWQLGVAGLIVGASWLSLTGVSLGAVRGAGVLVLLGHAVAVVVAGDADDLIVSRRRFRRGFLLAVLLFGLAIAAIETVDGARALPDWAFPVHAAAVGLAAAGFLLWAVAVRSDVWLAPTPPTSTGRSDSPARAVLAQRIEAAMAEGAWRQEGLTVAQLAAQLDTQEHRVRAAINQGMGHRHFAAYINGFRIDAAEAMLRDPALAERTVLSIAFEVGFASLGPFNRAFRARTGQTPTAFRKSRLPRG